MVFLAKAAVAVIIAVGAGGAQAATTHVFNLGIAGDDLVGSTDNSISILSDAGLTGTFTGRFIEGRSYDGGPVPGAEVDGSFGNATTLQRFNNGVGVCDTVGVCIPYGEERHSVDNDESRYEFVEMAFSDAEGLVDVQLQSLTFGWIGEWTVYDDVPVGYEGTTGAFEIVLDSLDDGSIGPGDELGLADVVTATFDLFNSRGTFDLSGIDLFDSVFGVIAGDGGSWKLLAVTVESSENGIPPIPLPGAFWLLAAGIGGLAAMKRRM